MSQPVDRFYGLFTTAEVARFVQGRLRDEGVRMTGGQIEWWEGPERLRRRLDDIDEIRLSVAPSGRGTTGGKCEITFRSFDRVVVHSTTAWSNHDAGRAGDYRDFVHDLHRSLSPEARRRITFHAGARGRDSAGVRALGVGLVGLVGVGILAALHQGGLRGLVIAITAGTVLLWPLIRQLRANRGEGGYGPDAIPDDLLP